MSKESWFESQQVEAFRLSLVPPIKWKLRPLSQWVKQSEYEAVHFQPSSDVVKNECRYIPHSSICLHALFRDSLSLTFYL